MNLEVLSSLILGNTGKLNFSSINCVKNKKIMQKMGKFSSNIRFLLLRETKGGDLVLYKIMFLVAFGQNWGEPVCQLTTCCRERASTC